MFAFGVELNNMKYDIDYSLDELTNLAKSLEIDILSRVTQKLDSINPKFYIGSGKVEELKNEVARYLANIEYKKDSSINRGIHQKISSKNLYLIFTEVNKGLERIDNPLLTEKELVEYLELPFEKAVLFLDSCLNLTDEENYHLCDLEMEFADLDGWNAESDAATLLNNLGISDEVHYEVMENLDSKLKVKVLLAQALFGNPDISMMSPALASSTSTFLNAFTAIATARYVFPVPAPALCFCPGPFPDTLCRL